MPRLTLVLGNRNFSSWSMRAWLCARFAGAAFEEVRIWLDEDVDREQRRRHAPTGKVPVLRVDDDPVWDSLAIAETLAELFPDSGLWPRDARARARARSVCAEMHSGFQALRERLPLNCRARRAPRDRGPAVAADVARVAELWAETRREFGSGGPFLFGARTAADAFYAPVASRFRTYAVELGGPAGAYAAALLEEPSVRTWLAEAEAEGHEVAAYSDYD